MGWFMGEVVGDGKNGTKIDLRRVKYGTEASTVYFSYMLGSKFFSAMARRYA